MIDEYVKEIRASLVNEQYYAALSLALTLPDICGSVEFPNKMIHERYIGWYDRYIGDQMKAGEFAKGLRKPYLSGEIVYNLRNSFLHNGRPDVDINKLKNADNQVQKFILYVCNTEIIEEVAVSTMVGDVPFKLISVEVRHLCNILCAYALQYYNAHKEDFITDSTILTYDGIGNFKEDMIKLFEDSVNDYYSKIPGHEKSVFSLVGSVDGSGFSLREKR